MLVESLGAGGMGHAHLAVRWPKDKSLPLVIKTLRADKLEQPEARVRFKQEAQLALSVSHPHIARVFDVGLVGTEPYFAMEYIPGIRLSSCLDLLVKRRTPLPIGEIPYAMAGLFDGLQALHDAKDAEGRPLSIVHRDVCPKNLIVDPDGQIRLIDLGIGWSPRNEWQTATGIVVGTPSHMSPEQVRAKPIDHRSDLYTLAIAIFEIITLARYATAKGVPDLLRFAATPVFRAPSILRSDVPKAVDRVLQKALAIDPDARFQSARELEVALLEAIGGPFPPASALRALVAESYDRARIEALIAGPFDVQEAGEPITVIGRSPTWDSAEHTAWTTLTSPGNQTKVMPTRPWSVREPTRPRFRWRRLVPVVTLGIGVVIGAQLASRPPKEPVLPRPVVISEEPKVVGAIKGPDEIAPEPVELPPPPPSPSVARPRVTPSKVVVPEIAAPKVDPIEALRARALKIKRTRPDRAAAVDEILADLAAERGSSGGPEVNARLSALSARLDGLTRAPSAR